MKDGNHLMRVEEFAAALGVKPSCIRRWICDRRISSVKVGRRLVRIPSSEVDRILSAGLRPFRKPRQLSPRHEPEKANV